MLDKEEVITKITDSGLVAVVRADTVDEALKITDACMEGGCGSIELTFTVPGAHRVIEKLANTYQHNEILLGAGTVLDSETARIAILSGAQFIVSACFDADAARLCNRYRMAYIPGIATIKEAITAMEAGAEILKVFPGDLYGPKIIRDIKGPLPYAKMMPTGGVSVDNAAEWIQAGAVALGAGGSLTRGARTGDYRSITDTAKKFLEKIKEARAQLSRTDS